MLFIVFSSNESEAEEDEVDKPKMKKRRGRKKKETQRNENKVRLYFIIFNLPTEFFSAANVKWWYLEVLEECRGT